MQYGAIILCGGKSTRMGRDKATLPFGPETMLQRIVRLLSGVVPVEHMVVVSAAAQNLPELPPAITVTHDQRPERGPLEGLAAGLRVLPPQVCAVYATSCDVPLLQPAFVMKLFALLDAPAVDGPAYDIVVPKEKEFHHPLAAAYRRSVLAAVDRQLDSGQLRPRGLFQAVSTREVEVSDLRTVDPELWTLKNLNTSEDYRSALQLAGYPPE